MQALKNFADTDHAVSHLIVSVVYANSRHVIYEVASQSLADECVAALSTHQAYTVSNKGRWFVSVPL